NLEGVFIFFASFLIKLDDSRIATHSAGPELSGTPRPFLGERAANDAVTSRSINIDLITVSKVKAPEVYAYSISVGAFDHQHDYLRPIGIEEFLRTRFR